MKEKIGKLKSILYINGKCASTRISRNYFVSIDQECLWDWVYDKTSNMPHDMKFVERLSCIENDILSPGICKICGSPTKYDRNIHNFQKYCCKECRFSDQETINLLKNNIRNKTVEQRIEIQRKKEATHLEKYGVKYPFEIESVRNRQRQRISDKFLTKEIQEKLNNPEWLKECYVDNGMSAVSIANMLDIKHYGTVLAYLRKSNIEIKQNYNRSEAEKEIEDFLKEYVEVIPSYSRGNKELDIYVPKFKFGVEYNGLFWHSYYKPENAIEINRHLDKKLHFKNEDIEVIHIDSFSWNTKKDIWKSFLRNKLGISEKIYARKCELKDVPIQDANRFLNENHLQGSSVATYRLGLYYNNELVSIMTFSKPRFNKKYDWELIRFCNKLNLNIVGGFSKLLSFFVKLANGSIISYADYSRSNGNVYIKNGFELVHMSKPGYYWIENKEILHSRNKFMKHKLSKILKKFDPDRSEAVNMFENGYRRYWDCGQMLFLYRQ